MKSAHRHNKSVGLYGLSAICHRAKEKSSLQSRKNEIEALENEIVRKIIFDHSHHESIDQINVFDGPGILSAVNFYSRPFREFGFIAYPAFYTDGSLQNEMHRHFAKNSSIMFCYGIDRECTKDVVRMMSSGDDRVYYDNLTVNSENHGTFEFSVLFRG